MTMKALVTGGTGFVGSNLALELKNKGLDVIITGNESEQRLPGIKCLYPTIFGINWKYVGKIDVLFHQAALNDTTNLDKSEMFFANYECSKELFSQAIAHGCKRVVYASSTAVYGDAPAPYKEGSQANPLNPYGASKLLLDDFVRMNYLSAQDEGLMIVGLRYCNIYGPRENHKGHRASMVFQLAQQMMGGRPKIFKFGEQRRDYVYVKDVVEANLLASNAKESCIVNCGQGKATSFNDLVFILNKTLNMDKRPVYIENPYGAFYQNFTECDMGLAKEKIGFVPKYDIEGGIKDYFESDFLVKG